MMCGLNYAILIMALLKLGHLVRTPIIESIKHLLRNLVNHLMIVLLGLSRL
jgi:hypothetical protein